MCPQGIPSGRNQEDMLNEVRKEAFNLRKTSTKDDEEEEDEEEEAQPSTDTNGDTTTIVGAEKWETWYPLEWIGWVMYGVPSENPTEHWVNQPTSSGPTDVEHYYTDEAGKRMSKKPPGRNVQRDRENNESITTKTTTDGNTMMSQRIVQMDQELAIASSAHQLQIMDRLQKNAVTIEEKNDAAELYREYLLNEAESVRQVLAEKRAKREREATSKAAVPRAPTSRESTPTLARTNFPDITSERAFVDEQSQYNQDEYDEDLFTPDDSSTPMEQNLGNQQTHESYSGQFSSEMSNAKYSLSQSSTCMTSPTQLYVSEPSASQHSRSQSSIEPTSSFTRPSFISHPTMNFHIATDPVSSGAQLSQSQTSVEPKSSISHPTMNFHIATDPVSSGAQPSESHYSVEPTSTNTRKSSISHPTMNFQIDTDSASVSNGRPPLAPKTKAAPTKVPEASRQYITRNNSPAKIAQLVQNEGPENPFRGRDYEFLNSVLHKRYCIVKGGIISVKNMNFEMANNDLHLLRNLKIGDVKDDEHLILTNLWVSKLRVAISKEPIQDDSDSDTS